MLFARFGLFLELVVTDSLGQQCNLAAVPSLSRPLTFFRSAGSWVSASRYQACCLANACSRRVCMSRQLLAHLQRRHGRVQLTCALLGRTAVPLLRRHSNRKRGEMSPRARVALVFAVLAVYGATGARVCRSEATAWYSELDSPGLTPKLFAPGIFSESNYREYVYVILPDRTACVFDRHADRGFPQGEIFISEFEEGRWTDPELFDVFREYDSVFLPTISPDGSRWFFTSESIEPPGGARGPISLFYLEKNDAGWGEPKYVGQHIHASATTDGTLFLMVEGRDWSRPAFRLLVDGDYSEYQFLEPAEYFMENDAHLVVDPEGAYVLFDSQSRPRIGECRLFVSFRASDGTWSEPASMGEYIEQRAAMAWISHDGEYIFYKACDDVYWVSAEIIEMLRSDIVGT